MVLNSIGNQKIKVNKKIDDQILSEDKGHWENYAWLKTGTKG